jgi:hypothetical protein
MATTGTAQATDAADAEASSTLTRSKRLREKVAAENDQETKRSRSNEEAASNGGLVPSTGGGVDETIPRQRWRGEFLL